MQLVFYQSFVFFEHLLVTPSPMLVIVVDMSFSLICVVNHKFGYGDFL